MRRTTGWNASTAKIRAVGGISWVSGTRTTATWHTSSVGSPRNCGNVPCTVEEVTPVTLGFLASDYVVHLRHHLAQVGVLDS
jgi:hypothetical protein